MYVDLRDPLGPESDLDEAGARCPDDRGCVVFYLNGRRLGVQDQTQAFDGLYGQGLCLVPALCMGTTAGGAPGQAQLSPFHPPDHPTANGGDRAPAGGPATGGADA